MQASSTVNSSNLILCQVFPLQGNTSLHQQTLILNHRITVVMDYDFITYQCFTETL